MPPAMVNIQKPAGPDLTARTSWDVLTGLDVALPTAQFPIVAHIRSATTRLCKLAAAAGSRC